ncbi:SDR family oxidoreductase [Notoacmeibacter ruber]|uniref:SDR family oxidoreductase n=1 Tax=Notoacmeibacter ruber TaxID=2670375 RepID=A0A3L7JF45_9HYPH|nr:SDR family oxidoreductase [Notoacmeibacter ruber]RLQ89084.1 SDR family oxidoreductase [Notoacmeibacter ruber]
MTEKGLLLVTGGSRGIGAAVAKRAAKKGWTVALTYRSNRQEAEALVASIRDEGGRASCHQCDVGDEASILRLFEAIDGLDQPLRGLVNNAGIVDQASPLAAMTTERMRRVFDVNILGAFIVAREAIRRMARSDGTAGGAIVNVSSIAAKLGGAGTYVDYAASKGAIDTLTVGLGLELAGQGVRVNAVRPGIIDTDIHADAGDPQRVDRVGSSLPMQRAGEPEEVADAILYLLSDEASYVTGALLDVSGGR